MSKQETPSIRRAARITVLFLLLAGMASAYSVSKSFEPDALYRQGTEQKDINGDGMKELVMGQEGYASTEFTDPEISAVRAMKVVPDNQGGYTGGVTLEVAGTKTDQPRSYRPRGDEVFYRVIQVNQSKLSPIISLEGWKQTGAQELHVSVSGAKNGDTGVSELQLLSGNPEIKVDYVGKYRNQDVIDSDEFNANYGKELESSERLPVNFFWHLDIQKPGTNSYNLSLQTHIWDNYSRKHDSYINLTKKAGFNGELGYYPSTKIRYVRGFKDNLTADYLNLNTSLEINGRTYRHSQEWRYGDWPSRKKSFFEDPLGAIGNFITGAINYFERFK